MIAMLISQGLGFIFSTNLAPLQASAAIASLGTPVILAWALKQHGWRNMRWSQFDGPQKRAIYRIALGSFFVNICAPLATALLGAGPAATATTVGSLMVGLLLMRGAPSLLLRVLVVIGVLLSTNALEGQLNVVGVIAAVLAAWHFWNLPGCLKTLGADQSDQGMVWANVFATPFVVIGALTVTMVQDHVSVLAGIPETPWMFGPVQWATMGAMACLVMVIPVFLTNAASRYLSKENMGAMQSMSAPIYALVGVVAGIVGLVHNPLPNHYQWGGFFIVTLAAASAVLVATQETISSKALAEAQTTAEALRKAEAALDAYKGSIRTGLSPDVLTELRSVGCTDAEATAVGRSEAEPFLVAWLMRAGATCTDALDALKTSSSSGDVSRYVQLRAAVRESDGMRLSHTDALTVVGVLSDVPEREARDGLYGYLRTFVEGGEAEPIPAMQAAVHA